MSLLSVDLAHTRHADIGVVAVAHDGAVPRAERIAVALDGRPEVERLADHLAALAGARGARLLLVDGPQAWKADDARQPHARECERLLAAPAKTGLPGRVKPAPYTAFVEFSIRLFDALDARGWPRLAGATLAPGGRAAVESFPFATWRALALPPLPAKRRATRDDVRERARLLAARHALALAGEPTHDELQALVVAVGGLALLAGGAGGASGARLVGRPPFVHDGHWREGFILLPASGAVSGAGGGARTA